MKKPHWIPVSLYKRKPVNVIQKEFKENINELLREKGISEDKTGSIMARLDSAIARLTIDQQANISSRLTRALQAQKRAVRIRISLPHSGISAFLKKR
jgi:hypothetical protein